MGVNTTFTFATLRPSLPSQLIISDDKLGEQSGIIFIEESANHPTNTIVLLYDRVNKKNLTTLESEALSGLTSSRAHNPALKLTPILLMCILRLSIYATKKHLI